MWFGELVWVEEGELVISVTAPGSLAQLTIRQMDLVESRATIFTTRGKNHMVGPTTQASDMDLAWGKIIRL